MTDPLVWFILLMGAPVGSFMAALADRFCAGQSLWTPSRCACCAARIAPYDLIPLASFVWLRGQCRECGARLPWRLFAAEGLGVLCALIAITATAGPVALCAAALLLWSLLGLALTDLRCFRLPDGLNALAFGAGLALAWADPARTLPAAGVGAACGGGALWALRWGYQRLRGREGLGLGDVKLAAVLGAALGAAALPMLGLIASVLALAAAGLGLFGPASRQTAVPFGLFLCLAGAVLFTLPVGF